MKHSSLTVGEMQLDNYVDLISEVYGQQDGNRSLWDVWGHALHHGAAIAERLRRSAPAAEVIQEIADFSLWLFTIVHKLRGEFGKPNSGATETAAESVIRVASGCSAMLWHKYPGLCPVCYGRRNQGQIVSPPVEALRQPCDCILYRDFSLDKDAWKENIMRLRAFSETVRAEKPTSIDQWQSMILKVFDANLNELSICEITLHLMEELGEAADAMVRMYSYKTDTFVDGAPRLRQLRLEAEIADIFSWLFAVVGKLELLKQNGVDIDRWQIHEEFKAGEPLRLSQIIWRRYGSESLQSFYCPFCEHASCTCELVFVPTNRSIGELLTKFAAS
jgi:NTP pyrophosphatase (non-canonical NTP hydrolase)